MTGRVLAITIVGAIVVVGCGDDANDGARRARMSVPVATTASGVTTAPTAPPLGSSVPSETVASEDAVRAPSAPVVEPTGEVTSVVALDNSFRPERIEIAVGDEVRWENRGLNDHDVLSVQGEQWGVEVEGFGPGTVYAHVFDRPGDYRYFCSIHGTESFGMTGTITVTP